jgi:DNA polymerase-3 subunit gamma/tau
MSDYIVTARKWRPMRFEDVVGQTHITTTLRNAMAAGRLAHAYLFSGPRGVGKTTTARLLAKLVNCLHPEEQNPDNVCENCIEITEGRSFDVLEIDGASNRGIEEIRNLRESVRYAPTKGSTKVYIIDEVHMLTKEAFNALLKTLEEPPAHVLFIFATTEINKVPPTILSRCQRFDFRRIRTDEIAENLRTIARAEGITMDEDALLTVARRGDGSLRDAQSLFDQVVALCGTTVTSAGIIEALNIVDQEVYFRVTDLIAAGDVKGGLALIEEIIGQGHDVREFVAGLSEHFRNLLVAKTAGASTLIDTAANTRQRYAEAAEAFSVADILRFQRLIAGTESALRWASQPRFKLEADLVQMITMPRAQEVGELLQKIDDLKKKLGTEVNAGPLAHRGAPPARPPASQKSSPGGQEKNARLNVHVSPVPVAKLVAEPQTDFSEHWLEFVGAVRERKISLWPALENARLLGVENGTFRIGCVDDFQASQLVKNKAILSGMLEEIFHIPARLTTQVINGGTEGSHSQHHERADTPGLEDHPLIAILKRELGAEPI